MRKQKQFIFILIFVVVLIAAAAWLYLFILPAPPNQNLQATELEQKAQRALTSKLQIQAEEIGELTVEAVDWPNTSLGCPKEGELYAQVVTLGYKILLQPQSDQTRTREFHSNDDFSQLVEC